ncbi:thioredoxin-like protein [Phlebopus sp. FC_14]|nr:thioredoxin-like protein [Phlebopus sp. FC_14]
MSPASTNPDGSAPRRSTRISARTTTVAAEVPELTNANKTRAVNVGKAGKTGKGKGTTSTRAKRPHDDEEEDGDGDGDEEHQPEEGRRVGSGRAKKAKVPVEQDERRAGPSGDDDSAQKELRIHLGDTLPSLVLQNESGEDVDTASLVAERGVVLFLVPRADTPGCTQQACGFRDIWDEFGTHNFDVYCLSADAPTAQRKWQTKKHLPYQLLSDPKRTLIAALGAADASGAKTRRSHFVFEKGGKLVERKIPVKPVDSPRIALAFIKGIVQ